MENGYFSLREIEKACKTDIRYMWLLDDMPAPSFVTIGNFIRDNLTDSYFVLELIHSNKSSN